MAGHIRGGAGFSAREKLKKLLWLAVIFSGAFSVAYLYYSSQVDKTSKGTEERLSALLGGLANIRLQSGAYYLIWECEEDDRHDRYVYEIDSRKYEYFERKGVLQQMAANVGLPNGVEESYHLTPEIEQIFWLIQDYRTEIRKVPELIQVLSKRWDEVSAGVEGTVIARVVERWRKQGSLACVEAVSLLATPLIWRELTRRLWTANFVRIDRELQRVRRHLDARALAPELLEQLEAIQRGLRALRPSENEVFENYDPDSSDFAALDVIRAKLLAIAHKSALAPPLLTGDKPTWTRSP